MESEKLNGGGCETMLDDSNLKINRMFPDVYKIVYLAVQNTPDLSITQVGEHGETIESSFRIGYKKFSIEGIAKGEFAGMIHLKIEK